MAAGFRGGDQISLGQDGQHRPGDGLDRGAVLGFDHFGDDVDVQFGVRCRRDGQRSRARQRVRDGAAADAGASRHGHPQRGGQPLGDRGAAPVANVGREPLQLIDENRMPLSAHVRLLVLLTPHSC